MNQYKNKNMKKKKKFFYICLLVLGLYVGWIFMNQQIELKKLYKQEEVLNQKIVAFKKEIARLEKEKSLGNDPKFIEKVAREKLKMVKSNEIIYVDMNKAK
ncbi:cell division protein FtsB [Marinisporobacter balticus]|uniref:Cell division protein FtsB n=2 Tax=Marinisporobacter balticus TaxID=2018667 RepID=A0A4V2SAE8_9FIRM|nr:cell division protein FtsB [Marinisporobacter balticus]